VTRPAQAVLDLPALTHNLKRVRDLAPGRRVMAVIKANGYGHGLIRVADALRGSDAFALACLDEALVLHEAGIRHPMVLLEGFFSPQEFPVLSKHRIAAVIHHEDQLRMLESDPPPGPLAVWLKVDSGMHRLGLAPERVAAAYRRLTAVPGVELQGLMTHLASADERDSPMTLQQLDCFARATAGIKEAKSIANSAAILAWPQSHADWVRPGIMLYGVSPFADQTGADHGLRPAMALHSQLMAVNRFKRGERVGYGGEWHCPEDMTVGVVAIGYGDGYPRHARGGTPVLVNAQRAPLIGRVSMDMICVDLRSQPEARVGDPVCLWGPALPVEEIARCAETIPYELLCRVTSRVRIKAEEGDKANA
jgi:alanine racemase